MPTPFFIMKCPMCSAASDVLSTRTSVDGKLYRRRECYNEHRFTTVEVLSGEVESKPKGGEWPSGAKFGNKNRSKGKAKGE